MIEFVMVIPLLVGIMAAVFFMTWVRGSEQRLRMLERHVPWHVAREGALLVEDDANTQILMTRAVELEYTRREGAPGGLLNGLAWGGNAGGHNTMLQPTNQTILDLTDMAGNTNWAGPIAEEALALGALPHGVALRVRASFPSNVGPWQRFLDLPFMGFYVREGPEWHHEQEPLLQAIAETHLRGLDDRLESIPAPGDLLGDVFQDMYLDGWDVSSDVE